MQSSQLALTHDRMAVDYAVALYALLLMLLQVVTPGDTVKVNLSVVRSLKEEILARAYRGSSGHGSQASSSRHHAASSPRQPRRDLDLLFAKLQAELTASERARRFMRGASKFGLPSYDNLLFRDNFIISYDNQLKHAVWVLDHITQRPKEGRCASAFVRDKQLHPTFSAQDEDYRRSDFDRGHMSPARLHKSNQRMHDQSYYFTNIAPQMHVMNAGVWQMLEEYVYNTLPKHSDDIYVVTGAMHNETAYKLIGRNRVGVPTYYYKVIVHRPRSNRRGDPMVMEAFVLPNDEDKSDPDVWDFLRKAADIWLDLASKFGILSGLIADFARLAISDVNKVEKTLQKFRIDINSELAKIERSLDLEFFPKIDRRLLRKPDRFLYSR